MIKAHAAANCRDVASLELAEAKCRRAYRLPAIIIFELDFRNSTSPEQHRAAIT
jgi:hypothetical protein